MLGMRILNQTTKVRRCGEAYIWRLTSLLVVTLPKFTIKPSAFSDTCKSYPFLCNASRYLYSHLVVEVQTLHGHSKYSGRSGLGLVTFLQTKHAQVLTIHIEL